MTDKKIYRFDGLLEEAIKEGCLRIKIPSKQKEESFRIVLRRLNNYRKNQERI